jgi:hypothetical protein
MRHQRQDVHLVYREQILRHLVFRQYQDVVVRLVCDTEIVLMVLRQIFRRHPDVVRHQDVVDVQQNLDVQNLDEDLTYFHRVVRLDVVVHLHPQKNFQGDVEVVGHLEFQMDYFQDVLVVDAVRLVFQMDCFQVVARRDVLVVDAEELDLVQMEYLLDVKVESVVFARSALEFRESLLLETRQILGQALFLQLLSSLGLSLLVSLHLRVLLQAETSQGIFERLVVQLLMMQSEQTRPSLGVLQGHPCYPSQHLLLIRKRGPLPLFSFCGPTFTGKREA